MMAKLGFDKKEDIHTKIYKKTESHKHVPGRAFSIDNPSEKLINMIGGGFFNEPRYYDTNKQYVDFLNEIINKSKITDKITDELGLTEQAREVMSTMVDIANSDNPEDLLIIAAWARDTVNGLKLRTTPQIALVIAAAHEKTKPFVRKYATKIMQRIDDVKQVFAAFRHLFQSDKSGLHKGTLPHCLRKGIAEVLSKASVYELMKYNSEEKPSLKDVLLMVSGSKKIPKRRNKEGNLLKDGWPLSKAVFEYIVNGKLLENAPDILKLRNEFFTFKNLNEVKKEHLEKAGLTWENIISHFGSNKDTWEMCIPLMGEMALTRNLRNFEKVGISKESWNLVYEKLEKVENMVQLPFRFFAAYNEVESTNAKSIITMQLDKAVKSLPDLPGITVVLTDNSGSAQGAVVSKNSEIRVSDCGNMLEAILAKRLGRKVTVGVFGDVIMWVPFDCNDSTMKIKLFIDEVAKTGDHKKYNALGTGKMYSRYGVGGSTETGLWFAINDLIEKKIFVDRIILLSDLCCYTQGDNNCGINMNSYFGKGGDKATIASMIEKYRRVVNNDCKVYSINLAGYGQSQLKPKSNNTYLMSGWSENIIKMINDIENVEDCLKNNSIKTEMLSTMLVLRSRYGLN